MSALQQDSIFLNTENFDSGKVRPMPPWHAAGSGRDLRFSLPQYFADINGLRTAFFDAGEGEPIVFIHGLAGNITHFLHVAPAFAQTHRVIGLDLLGCGESAKPAQWYSVNRFVAQVRGLLDILEVESATIVGHSLGGMVAAQMGLEHPNRVKRAVLINPAGTQPLPLVVRLAGHLVLRRPLLSQLLPRAWKLILANVFYQENEYTRSFIESCEHTYNPEDVHQMARLMDKLRPDLLDRHLAALLPELNVPAWLIWGEKDRLVPADFLKRASHEFPQVVIEEIERCGHMPIIEQPERIVAFLKRALNTV